MLTRNLDPKLLAVFRVISSPISVRCALGVCFLLIFPWTQYQLWDFGYGRTFSEREALMPFNQGYYPYSLFKALILVQVQIWAWSAWIVTLGLLYSSERTWTGAMKILSIFLLFAFVLHMAQFVLISPLVYTGTSFASYSRIVWGRWQILLSALFSAGIAYIVRRKFLPKEAMTSDASMIRKLRMFAGAVALLITPVSTMVCLKLIMFIVDPGFWLMAGPFEEYPYLNINSSTLESFDYESILATGIASCVFLSALGYTLVLLPSRLRLRARIMPGALAIGLLVSTALSIQGGIVSTAGSIFGSAMGILFALIGIVFAMTAAKEKGSSAPLR